MENTECGDIPADLRDAHYSGAKNSDTARVTQIPSFVSEPLRQTAVSAHEDKKNAVYYVAGENKTEQAAKKYWDAIKNDEKKSKTD